MKKFILSLVATSAIFAASNEQIAEFYTNNIKSQYPNAKITLKDRTKVGDTGFESVIMEAEFDGQKQSDIIFTKDDLIMPDLIDIKNKISYRQNYEMKKFQDARDSFEKNAKVAAANEPMRIIMGDSKKPVMYVFSDPECPFCRRHLEGIEKDLKDYQVHYILTPVHGKSSFEKSALIYKEAKNAKSDNDKIAILRKYYNPSIKNYPEVSDAELKEVFALFEKYRAMGFRATPTIIK